jgi:hypothetical protein
MQFMILHYETANDLARSANPETTSDYWGAWTAYVGAMYQAGVVVNGAGLQPPATATSVRLRDGKRQIHDGPFADTKEHLAGFFIIEVPSLDEAIAWAARAPSASTGTTEVRPVLPPPPTN